MAQDERSRLDPALTMSQTLSFVLSHFIKFTKEFVKYGTTFSI